MIDRRVAATGLVVVAFGAGWGLHALLFDPPDRPMEVTASSAATPPASTPAVVAPPPSAAPVPTASASTQEVFDDIYREGKWGRTRQDAGSSGYGSSVAATFLYRTFLAQFMKETAVKTVVDAGCGDWEFSRAIDWAGIDYKGFDIVESVVEADKKKYARPNVQFFVANMIDDELPPADLLIVKNVLQHLPTADVEKFLKQLPKYKHVLLIDGVNSATLSGKNEDIPAGKYRDLDFARPPFNLRVAKLLTYWDGGTMQQVVYVSHGP
jgi:SAM-dependent methyltransferase